MIDIIFLVIITSFCAIGVKKGCIKSIGGLLAVIVSWLASRTVAAQVSRCLFNYFVSKPQIDSVVSIFNDENGSNIITETINIPIINVWNIIIIILLFSVCMFVCGVVVSSVQIVFEKIPLGKTVNMVLGGVCGLIKGIILSALVYCGMYIINVIIQANIPLNETVISRLFEMIVHIFL
jgi:uncharacterized membrane protein required for colicin V production